MTNTIHEIRQAIELALASARPCPDEFFTELSPCGRYRLEIEEYVTPEGADYSVAVVRHADSGQEIATVKRNDSRCFYGWVSRAGHDYLLLPEDLEGQTVIDLTTGQVAGYSTQEPSFIWTEFHPSPDRTRIAIIGCYWACPYQVTVYDFHDPLDLPLHMLCEFVLPESYGWLLEWVTETTFRIQCRDGSFHVFEVPGGKSAEPGSESDRGIT